MPNEMNQPPPAKTFSQGIRWLAQSLALMRMQPARLLLIAVFMQVILGLTQLPLIGMLIIVSVPALSAGVLEALDVTSRGRPPGLNLLFRPLTSGTHTGRLFLLGLLVFAVGILSISLMLSGNEQLLDPEMVSRIEQGDMNAITELDQDSLGKMVMAFLVGISISGTLSYFTIPLIWFDNRRLGPALIEGIKALVVHWRPFLMLALGLFVICIPVILVTGVLVRLAGSGGVLSVVVMGCVMILLLAFQMLLFATEYCAFRDIFGIGERGEPPPPEAEDQLVA
jgi:hypothetical protein